jgi:serine/threonine protein kinase
MPENLQPHVPAHSGGSPDSPLGPATQTSTSVAQPPLQIPDHELLRCIGRGSYGEVWLARSVVGTWRAVKVVRRATFERAEHFEREFRGIQKFEPISRSHDGFVDILQIGRNDEAGYFYYVMELADDLNAECGARNAESASDAPASDPQSEFRTPHSYAPKTLRAEQQRHIRLPVSDCVDIGITLASALAHLHKHGLVHRDIKPSNIIFVGGVPKLADIGLVASMDKTMSFVGTSGFLPPEGPGTPQADLYSLGKVLYEISTGQDRQDFPQKAALVDGRYQMPAHE